MQDLKFLAQMSRVQQLHQRILSPTEMMRLRRAGLGNERRRVTNEKRLMSFENGRAKSVLFEACGQPVPTHVAGEVLFARAGEKIVRLLMSIIRASSSERTSLCQFTPALPIVARDE